MKLLDVVSLAEDLPERGLRRGQLGTIIEMLSEDIYEVEFNDSDGRAYAVLALNGDQLMVLKYDATKGEE